MDAVSPLTVETFRHRVGEGFVAGDGGPALELVEVTDHADRGAVPGGRRPFALLFRGPSEAPLGQGVHPLRHPELGELPLFLVPVGAGPDGVRYEAVFS